MIGLLGITYSLFSADWDGGDSEGIGGVKTFNENLERVKEGVGRGRSNAKKRDVIERAGGVEEVNKIRAEALKKEEVRIGARRSDRGERAANTMVVVLTTHRSVAVCEKEGDEPQGEDGARDGVKARREGKERGKLKQNTKHNTFCTLQIVASFSSPPSPLLPSLHRPFPFIHLLKTSLTSSLGTLPLISSLLLFRPPSCPFLPSYFFPLNLSSSARRALGDTKSPFWYSVCPLNDPEKILMGSKTNLGPTSTHSATPPPFCLASRASLAGEGAASRIW
jgi:hypothetical protein